MPRVIPNMLVLCFACLWMCSTCQVSLRYQCPAAGMKCEGCFPGSDSLPCLPQKFPFPTDAECKVECRDRSAGKVTLFQCPFSSGQCVPCVSAQDAEEGEKNICIAPFIDFTDCQSTTICGNREGVYCDFFQEACKTCTGDDACSLGAVKKFKTFAECNSACRIDSKFKRWTCSIQFSCDPCIDGTLSIAQACPASRNSFSTVEECRKKCIEPVEIACKDEFDIEKPNEIYVEKVENERDCNGNLTQTVIGSGCACKPGTVRDQGVCIKPANCTDSNIKFTCNRDKRVCIPCGTVIDQECPLDRSTFRVEDTCNTVCREVADRKP